MFYYCFNPQYTYNTCHQTNLKKEGPYQFLQLLRLRVFVFSVCVCNGSQIITISIRKRVTSNERARAYCSVPQVRGSLGGRRGHNITYLFFFCFVAAERDYTGPVVKESHSTTMAMTTTFIVFLFSPYSVCSLKLCVLESICLKIIK